MKADEPSVPTINVGGNFTQGNISGQSAIGNNISQILYKDCTFLYPDGSIKNGYSWIYTQGARPVIDLKKVFGREKEIESIEDLLKDKSALVITGFCGTGKSTLASMFVDRTGNNRKFAGTYWRKVDETTDISEIIGSFFTVISKPVKDLARYKIADQIDLLFKELDEAPYLLVLDNFETLLDPQTNKPLESKVGFSDLIEKANENSIRSKILFTSWESISSERGVRPFFYQINGLDIPAGIQLLRREGLRESEEELKKAVELSGGHPLALLLLSQLIKEEADTLSALLEDDSLWIGDDGEVAENILNKVYKERLSEEERKLLQYISIFRQPVSVKAIGVMASNPQWTERRLKKVALKLTRKSLIHKAGINYWEESLISKYAGNQLSDRSNCHELALTYYLSLALPVEPAKREDIQFLIEAHYHACVIGKYDLASHIIFSNGLPEKLDLWGNYIILIDLYSKLLPKARFEDEIILSKKTHGTILGNLGITYYRLSEIRKAIEYYKQALIVSREIGDRKAEGIHLGNLGLAYRDLGELDTAIQYYNQAIAISREIGDKLVEGNNLGNLGNAYRDLGDVRKAIEYNDQAILISRNIGNQRGEGNHLGSLGNAYFQLGEVEKAIEYYEQALLISRKIGDRLAEGKRLGNLGNSYRELNEIEKAIEYYNEALVISREIGDRYSEGAILGNLGSAYSNLGEIKTAIEHYKQAIVISRRIGDNINEGNHLGNLGLAYGALGELDTAIDYCNLALDISRKTGHRRGACTTLYYLGLLHNDLGKVDKVVEYYGQALSIGKEIEDLKIINLCKKALEALKDSK